MQREIKFKGKSIKGGDKVKWVYGGVYDGSDFGKMFIVNYLNGLVEVDPDTVCQFTGLFDKEGIEIWEHDIVRLWDYVHPLTDRIESDVYFVEWGKESAMFGLTNNGLIDDGAPHFGLHFGWHKVIGNRFDNKELLKE